MGESMDRSGRIFRQFGPFEEAFPMLEDATVEYTERDHGIKKGFTDVVRGSRRRIDGVWKSPMPTWGLRVRQGDSKDGARTSHGAQDSAIVSRR